ncbi:MAG: ABC transporter permease [Myxococcota bacterium]|nr:ABC transporter permease [Myxococcota bacterium]
MNTLALAWRNVWRNKRRTVVTVSAMTLALTAMILYSGLVNGYLRNMQQNILDLEVGDIQVFAAGYRENPSLYARIDETKALLGALDKAGFKASARALANGLAAAGDTSAGVLLRGIDPERNATVSAVRHQVMAGQWLGKADPQGVVIGKRLARNLGVRPGDEIVVLTQGADGSIANDLFTVRGILKNVGEATDRAGVFMLMAAFRELMVMPTGTHQIIVRKPETLDLNAAAAKIRAVAPNLDVKTWRDLFPTIATMLDSTANAVYVMALIVYIAIGIVMLNAMLMAVFERIREFGVLKALGMGPGRVFGLILTESGVQAAVALVVGTAVSLPGSWYLTTYGIDTRGLADMSIGGVVWNPIWRSSVTPGTYIGPMILMLIIVFFAALYPSVKAALIQPVRAIYHR